MVDFGGWEMPQQYTSIRDEHLAVRKAAGLFDVSHMGRFRITGPSTTAFVQRLVTNDVSGLEPGHAQYNLMCNESGGIVDDLVVYCSEDGFLAVVNASNREKDLDWMRAHAPADVTIEDRTFELGLIAFQGPEAQRLMPAQRLDDIPYFGFRNGDVAGVSAVISRTGYTGEDGFEIMVKSERVGQVWDAILEGGAGQGVLPAGLGARDAARLEAALRLWGNDMDESVNAYEAGLGWTVKLDKGEFLGREALQKVKAEGPQRRLLGLKMQPGDIARHGAAVSTDGRRVPDGGRNVPAATSRVATMRVLARFSLARLSHGVARAGSARHATAPMASRPSTRVLVCTVASPHHRKADRPIAILRPLWFYRNPRVVDNPFVHLDKREARCECG